MKTHKKKQKKTIKKYKKNNKTQKAGWHGPIDYIKEKGYKTYENAKQSVSDNLMIHNQLSEERGNRRLKYIRGQIGDKFRSIGHKLSHMKNPIVFAYQLIEKEIFKWGVKEQIKPKFIPKHEKVSFKQFLESDIPELTEKAKKKAEEKKKAAEEEEKKKAEEEKEKKNGEEEENKNKEESTQKPVLPNTGKKIDVTQQQQKAVPKVINPQNENN